MTAATKPMGWLARLARTPRRPTATELRRELVARAGAAVLFAQHGDPATWETWTHYTPSARRLLAAYFVEWSANPRAFPHPSSISDAMLARLANLEDGELDRMADILDGLPMPEAGTRRKPA